MDPGDLQCDASTFTNYPGVEEKDVTTTEMQTHIDFEHLPEFDTFEELEDFVGGKPILNKLGVIEKVRNGVTRARTILDTKARVVKRITG